MSRHLAGKAEIAKVDGILEIDHLTDAVSAAAQARSLAVIEEGGILFLPNLLYVLTNAEHRFLDPVILNGKAKNVSFHPTTRRCGGTGLTGKDRVELAAMMARFADWTLALVRALLPRYAPSLTRGMTSLRLVEIEGRASSLCKDDTRLHVDAFRAQPVQGRRIMRVFANVSAGEPRVWHVGEPFPAFADRFVPRIRPPLPGSAWLMRHLGITKGRRTPYDHMMLQLHDLAKKDEDYQRDATRTEVGFPGGSCWIVCTDATLHAAMRGRQALEQTFFFDVAAMAAPEQSPLRVLERATGRPLL